MRNNPRNVGKISLIGILFYNFHTFVDVEGL